MTVERQVTQRNESPTNGLFSGCVCERERERRRGEKEGERGGREKGEREHRSTTEAANGTVCGKQIRESALSRNERKNTGQPGPLLPGGEGVTYGEAGLTRTPSPRSAAAKPTASEAKRPGVNAAGAFRLRELGQATWLLSASVS